MKKTKLMVCVASAALLTACNFFNSESPSAMDAQTVYGNAVFTEQTIASVYDLFGNDNGYRNRLVCGYMGVNTDIEQGKKDKEWTIYTITPACSDLGKSSGKDAWGYMNVAIERCNNIIEGIEAYGDLSNKQMEYYLGEAYFLRSFLFLDMVKLWGDIPARFESLSKNPDGVNTPKINRNIVYEHLRSDLKKAAEYLPYSKDCPGPAANTVARPSKSAALALLMRNDMYYAGRSIRPKSYQTGPVENVDVAKRQELYQEVLWAMSQIQQGPNESTKLLDSFEKVFRNVCEDVTNYYQTETLWEIPFKNGARGQFLQYNCPKSSDALKGLKNNTSGSTNSSVKIVPTLYFDYEKGDARRDVTIAPFCWIFDNGTKYNSDKGKRQLAFPEVDVNAGEKFVYQKFQQISEFYLGKYRVEWMVRERNGNDDGVNFPVIRYADCLLMAAEASIGGITGDVPAEKYGIDGQDCFNRVRTRAGLGTKQLTMDNIKEERKFEFAGEYLRKFDLMRWGILKETLENAHARLLNLCNKEGEYANVLPDTIYYKYKYMGSEYSYSGTIKSYVLDSVYGLNKGEVGQPEYYNSENGWAKKNIYKDSDGKMELAPANYRLYDNSYPENLNSRQLWPIFTTDMTSSVLWNDYGYN